MSDLVQVKLSSIDPNPMRRLKQYPYDENKLAALRQSIKAVGLWEGIIARKVGGRYQQAFGHHRTQAARKELGAEAKVPLIVRDLDDREMLQFMGRENLEDYNANFLVMLESWDAAKSFAVAEDPRQIAEAIDIAQLLGWTCISHRESRKDGLEMREVAMACNAASQLISGGYLTRDALTGLSVNAVRQICQRMVAQHEQLDRMAKQTQRPAKETEQAKKIVGRAGKTVARDVRMGRVAERDIRGRVDVEAYRAAREDDKPSPLFTKFGKDLVNHLEKLLDTDSAGEKLQEIKESLKLIETDQDLSIVSDIAYQCGKVAKRAAKWQQTFENPTKRVVKLREIS